ncbi:MAG: diguanylate cyclase [Bacteroidales bacterium]|nr:diguanylate cyclase [Bacteroidales bacterium]
MDQWFESLKTMAVTVCDAEGNVLDMNQRSADVNSHGQKIIGSNLMNCHPEPARTKLQGMLERHELNAYTIEKNGVKKLIYQVPWWQEDGSFGGLVEFSVEIPFEMPHYVRQPKTSD